MSKITSLDDRIVVSFSNSSGVSDWTGKKFNEGDIVIDFFNKYNCSGTILASEINRLIERVKEAKQKDKSTLKRTTMDSGIVNEFVITEVDFDINKMSITDKVECNVCGEEISEGDKILAGMLDIEEDTHTHLSLNIHMKCFPEFEEFIKENVEEKYKKRKNERIFYNVYIKRYTGKSIKCKSCGKKSKKGVYSTIGKYECCIECFRKIIKEVKEEKNSKYENEKTNVVERCIVCGGYFEEEDTPRVIKLDYTRRIHYHDKCEKKLARIPEKRIDEWSRENISRRI